VVSRGRQTVVLNEVKMIKTSQSKELAGSQLKYTGKIELKSPYALRRNSRNVRTHSKKQIRQISRSIDCFGFNVPVLVDADLVILAGHGRVEAAKTLKLKEIPVIRIDHLSETAKRAFTLADNKIAQNAGWDNPGLLVELSELVEDNLDLEIIGFETAELDALASDFDSSSQSPPEDIPSLPKVAASVSGDIWELCGHRVTCGDSRQSETFQRLMGGEKAFMTVADAPYNVRISGHAGGRGRTKHREFAVASGELSSPEFTSFLKQILGLCADNSIDGSIHYVFMDWRHSGELLDAGRSVYDELKNVCVWVKTNAGQGSFYRSQHELIYVYKKGGAEHLNTFELGQYGRSRTNVWTYAGVNAFRAGRMDDLGMHPTVKPTALVADAMKDCSKRGSIVLDPFLGSGTTLIAAEQVGRRCYGIELDPGYVDLAVERWQRLTKRDAVLEGTSLTFDELRSDPSLRTKIRAAKLRAKRPGARK
jgi:DNA modification methylase